ncbi:leucyl/phenylalanyl-tRNA--protein transferase [Alteriqipengyuania lutimaris]|nr:leucyl/phenylalanyl-tRNA--protein transferase [Alteriqipengyuania lutimaris]MBB3033948.1 leucyl/phenylalanyl-tRNA--protein transferase [Alteriqipengyuania lutimaris]
MLPIVPPPVLLSAYRQGLFPMAESRRDQDIFWVEPRERAIIPIGEFHCSRSLARTIRREVFTIRVDSDFAATVLECAAPRRGKDGEGEGTWISGRIAASYQRLHEVGHAHSIECWQAGELVGGVYGVAFDRVFCGESMFSRRRDGSKVALAWLLALLERAGCELFDCQFMTGHLASLGAIPIPQSEYLERLERARGTQRISLPEALREVEDEARAHAASSTSSSTTSSSPGKLIAHSLTHTS